MPMSGSSLTAFTHSETGCPADQIYLIFYQHNSGNIRVTTLLHDRWNVYKVTSDAKNGTGLSAMITDYSYSPSATTPISGCHSSTSTRTTCFKNSRLKL